MLSGVLQGDRTQAEAARLLCKSARHARRLQRRLEAGGDQALVHGLRGRPSNHRADPAHRQKVLMARFYPAGTVEAHMDLIGRPLRRHGRPLAFYSDRHSTFEPQDKGKALPGAETQLGRALRELGIELIRARSPQAKGRGGRSFGTAQDRWAKELRLAGAATRAQSNAVLERLLPGHNRRFSKAARQAADAHRPLGPGTTWGRSCRCRSGAGWPTTTRRASAAAPTSCPSRPTPASAAAGW